MTELGRITDGSLLKGLTARVTDDVSVEDLRVGRFVVIDGDRLQFFSTIHNVELRSTNPDVALKPPETAFAAQVLAGTNTYAVIELKPKLVLEPDVEGVRPVKTIPPHFSTVREAEEVDVTRVFGEPGDFRVPLGTPLEMQTPVCIDLKRFVERSNGLFGKTGTGKSFLARILLASVIQTRAASVLVFDMHSEYGEYGTDEVHGRAAGLKNVFPSEVEVWTLDKAHSARRRVSHDAEIRISTADITPEDIALLRGELGLSEAQLRDMEMLSDRIGKHWMTELLEANEQNDMNQFATSWNVNEQAATALARNLAKITRLPFVHRGKTDDPVSGIVGTLRSGRNVVIEFGGQSSLLSYLLVSSILTRRIHSRWQQDKETADGDDTRQQPPQLVVTIEEAHKFLAPEVVNNTIFGTIAREMRKYNVTLLVIDQRPSGIDDEVRSQLGTRVVAALDDDKDQSAVLSGVPDAGAQRILLNNLEPKQQILLAGYAVPMPIVLNVRDWKTYAAQLRKSGGGEGINLWR